ncbi:MAG: NAD(P)/FAD-dependent oxidoreductase [Pseudorhodoplanes sp.]
MKAVAIVGAGPAGLMAAETLARSGISCTVYEQMPSPARKFLLAGRGGLNLTHSEDFERLLGRYAQAAPRLRAALEAFPPAALRTWAEALGQSTFVGSSGRVFPQAMKASPLLRAWLRRLDALGVAIRLRHRLAALADMTLDFDTPQGRSMIAADAIVLALGGASWPRLGSDGRWVDMLNRAGVEVAPLRPSNMGFLTNWSERFASRFAGEPLKRIALRFGDHRVRGEAIITRDGIEGGAVYALSAPLRDAVAADGEAVLHVDLRPDLDAATVRQRLGAPRVKQSLATFLRKSIQLSPAAIGLLQEITKGNFSNLSEDAQTGMVKNLPLRLTACAPLLRAISSAGGVSFEAIDEDYMLRARPGIFVAGEMLDWEAPTGGYLLQASFATGFAAGQGVLRWLKQSGQR